MRADATEREFRADRARLDPLALGLTGALTLAAWVVSVGVLARVGWGDRWRWLLADLYPGYGSTPRGLLVGAAWASVDGFTVGVTFAWLYNRLAR